MKKLIILLSLLLVLLIISCSTVPKKTTTIPEGSGMLFFRVTLEGRPSAKIRLLNIHDEYVDLYIVRGDNVYAFYGKVDMTYRLSLVIFQDASFLIKGAKPLSRAQENRLNFAGSIRIVRKGNVFETSLLNSDAEYQKALSLLESQNPLFGQNYEPVNISNL